jgi:hypothetical protein
VFVFTNPLTADCAHGKEAEWKIEQGEAEIHSQRGVAVFFGERL